MIKFLLSFILICSTLLLNAQQGNKDSAAFTAVPQRVSGETTKIRISIYPVPVTNNTFTIRTDRDISFVKITNIIGQDVFRSKYNNPLQLIRITLDAPQRGMYLVTVIFSDGARIVKKIMIEEPK